MNAKKKGEKLYFDLCTIYFVFRKWDVGVRTGLRRLRIGTGAGHL
jgi:hypothetical protein